MRWWYVQNRNRMHEYDPSKLVALTYSAERAAATAATVTLG